MSTRSERIRQLVEDSNMSYVDLEKLTGIKNHLFRDTHLELLRRYRWMLLKNCQKHSMYPRHT